MADLIHQASDDQVALAICFLAVASCGLVMHFSRQVGEWTGRIPASNAAHSTAAAAERTQSLPVTRAMVREKAA